MSKRRRILSDDFDTIPVPNVPMAEIVTRPRGGLPLLDPACIAPDGTSHNANTERIVTTPEEKV
jgi:hypothetical protein